MLSASICVKSAVIISNSSITPLTTCNKNTIPFETESPFVTSGLRMGTPAMTTRGFKEDDMLEVADLIIETLTRHKNGESLEGLHNKVEALTSKYPLYED